MKTPLLFLFPPFRLDVDNEQLWRGMQAIELRPKTFAVLRYLVEHPGRLVTKEEMLDTVWPQTVVSEWVLKSCVRELRKALDDDAQTPQYIATVHRRGYRFIAEIVSSQHSVVSSPHEENQKAKIEFSSPAPNPQPLAPTFVGRGAELAQLHHWLDKALHGERQIVFVTGEPGIGKTTLIDAFRQRLEASPHPTSSSLQSLASPVSFAHGQCIEHYGAGEGYLPVLEALGRLCREPNGERLIKLLSQHAPTWLIQMPALLGAAELEMLQRKTQGATRERMLREMAEAVEVMTADRLLVLVFEDLHWGDYSTLDLLSYLARRRERARLLMIGTYRPVEVLDNGHPLRAVTQELQLHGHCVTLPLGWLTEAAVTEYLAVKFGEEAQQTTPFQGLAHVIHQHTEGNPLFMVNVIEHMVAQGSLARSDGRWVVRGGLEEVAVSVPENLRQMIEKHLDRLKAEDRRALEVASVAGVEFSAAAVAAGEEATGDEVEERCAGLARRSHFLQERGLADWPDGTVATRYGFIHALYHEVVYARTPAGRRVHLHRRIGEREERAYGDRVGEIATELAVHFERGRDYRRAVHYLQQTGENAARRHAYREAVDHLSKGLELLKALPDAPERLQQELLLQTTLGSALIAAKGQATPEVATAYTRARALCQQLGETPQLFPVLLGLRRFYLVQAELQTARELGEQLLSIAHNVQDPSLLLEAQAAVAVPLFWLGELTPARAHLEQGIALYDPQRHSSHVFLYGYDPGVLCRVYAALVLWHLGYPDQALRRTKETLILAEDLSHPYSLAFAQFTALVHQYRREGDAAQERAKAMLAICNEQAFPFWLAEADIFQGWALVEQGKKKEGIAQMRRGLAAHCATGVKLARPHFLALLAEAYAKAGQVTEGLTLVVEALTIVDANEERSHEAELYRLYGDLSLRMGEQERGRTGEEEKIAHSPIPPFPHSSPEECFLKAIEIARKQRAKSLELRATMSLVRLRQQQALQDASRTTQHETRTRLDEAHKMLSEIYGWFTEGFDTKDLQEAKTLLEELA